MWGSIKGKKRCAVLCEGYYEWLKKGKERFPHFTKQQNGNLMLLAGLYDCVTLEGQTEPLWTFTIVTTAANSEFSWLHERQPVILSTHEALETWLDTSGQTWTKELTKLVEPYHDQESPLTCYQVPKEVGKVGTESATFIEPVSQRKDGIQAMFAKQKGGSSTVTSPVKGKKRQLDESPPSSRGLPHENDNKKPKTEKVNAWEDDSDIEYIDTPSASQSSTSGKKATRVQAKTSKTNSNETTPRKKKPLDTGKTPSVKITSFFSKA